MIDSAIWPPSNFRRDGGIITKWEQRKTLRIAAAAAEDVRYLRPQLLRQKPKTNVNSTCDVTNLDQIGPISVQDV